MFYIHSNIYIHRYLGCLHELEIQMFQKIWLSDWANRLDTNDKCKGQDNSTCHIALTLGLLVDRHVFFTLYTQKWVFL